MRARERERARESESERERHNLGHLWSWETYFFKEVSRIDAPQSPRQTTVVQIFVEDGHSIDEVNTVGERLMALACTGVDLLN